MVTAGETAKLTYPKVMRKHLVPYVHKVDRNGTKLRDGGMIDAAGDTGQLRNKKR